MSDLHSLIPSINELLRLLEVSHASKGGTVLLQRSNSVWNNPSSQSILNAWGTKHRIIQTSFLEIASGGDGGKLGCFIAGSLIRQMAKLVDPPAHPVTTQRVSQAWSALSPALRSKESSEEVVLQIGARSELDPSAVKEVASAIYLAGSMSSHVALEKYTGVGCEVDVSEALHSRVKVHLDKEENLKGAMFALFSRPVFHVKHILGALEQMGGFEGRPLVLIAPMIGGEALKTINLNRHKGVLEAYAVDAPRVTWGRGWLDDLASFTGATVFDPEIESDFQTMCFGSALEVLLNYQEMFVYPYEDHAETTAERAESLLREAEETPYPHSQDLLRSRANALTGSLVRLKVGGNTEAEARWNRVLAEKALLSMSDAVRNGYVEGAIPLLASIETGDPLLNEAFKYPLKVVAKNLGMNHTDPRLLDIEELYDPFPFGRLLQVLDRAVSVATTIASVGKVVYQKR
jgi:chaperonin GroEL